MIPPGRCPECRQVLEVAGSDTLRCPHQGKTFQVLFSRQPIAELPQPQRVSTAVPLAVEIAPQPAVPPPAPATVAPPTVSPPAPATVAPQPAVPPPAPEPIALPAPPRVASLEEGLYCRNHPQVRISAVCARCEAGICTVCSHAQADGTHRCPSCVDLPFWAPIDVRPENLPPPLTDGSTCMNHPQVAAVWRCTECSNPVCATCTFSFAGDIRLCPSCATTPVASKTGPVVIALVLAVWSAAVLAVLISGALAELFQNPVQMAVMGALVAAIGAVPALSGIGLTLSVYLDGRSNPPLVWVALIANSLASGLWFLISLLGILGI